MIAECVIAHHAARKRHEQAHFAGTLSIDKTPLLQTSGTTVNETQPM